MRATLLAEPAGLRGGREQIVLSALDGAACQLHVSREDMVLALANPDSRQQFVREHNISNGGWRARAQRAEASIDDAQHAGALNPTFAGILRGVVGNLPIDELLNLLQRLRGLWHGLDYYAVAERDHAIQNLTSPEKIRLMGDRSAGRRAASSRSRAASAGLHSCSHPRSAAGSPGSSVTRASWPRRASGWRRRASAR